MNLIFIAPPAAGKGTQAKLMLERGYNLEHISTGDLLREKALTNETIRETLNQGLFVSDEFICELLFEKLSSLDKGFILDGFPRNIKQAEMFEKILFEINKKIDYVFYFDTPKEELLSRVVNRRTCLKCSNIYNIIKDNINNNKCPKCNNELNRREDDTKEVYETRYNTYIERTSPLIKYYEDKKILIKVESLFIENTYNQIEKVLKSKDSETKL